MDDVLRRHVSRSGDLGVARRASPEFSACLEYGRPASAVDRAVDPAAAEQRRIGRVDNGVHRLLGQVALDHLDDARAR